MEESRDSVVEGMSLEDVGEVEQVVQRLLHERRALENVSRVLSVYRKSFSQVKQVWKELDQAKVQLAKALDDVRDAKIEGSKEIARVNGIITESVKKADADIAEKERLKTVELDNLAKRADTARQEFDTVMQERSKQRDDLDGEIRNKQAMLSEIKKDHDMVVAGLTKMLKDRV